jgi:hypothetical protein
MTSPDRSAPDHLHPDDEALAQYASVSRWAVLAVALGLVSSLVLVSPVLVVLPLAAIVVAVLAMRQIAASEGRLLGHVPATVGLCLATLFMGWGLSRQFTREAELTRQAQQFAEGWLILVRQGKLQEADQLVRTPDERLHDRAAIAEFYATNQEASDSMKAIFNSDRIKGYTAAGPSATFELVSVDGRTQQGYTDNVVLRYSLGGASSGERKPLWITVQRMIDPVNKLPGWRIHRADSEPPTGVSSP